MKRTLYSERIPCKMEKDGEWIDAFFHRWSESECSGLRAVIETVDGKFDLIKAERVKFCERG